MRNNIATGFLAGMLIGIGGVANLSVDNKIVGAFLFSMGLFYIIRFQLALYTGKVGYMITKDNHQTFPEVSGALLGNILGTAFISLAMLGTRFGPALTEKADAIMQAKLSGSIRDNFALAILCGFLMYLAVHHGRQCHKEEATTMVFGTVLPVMAFMLSGFNHSIADSFYIIISSYCADYWYQTFIYLVTVILGNAIGAFIPSAVYSLRKD